ncbi:MAG: efflux RND transporter periplasmic adaptor subunit [Chitinophagales bacterium]|nr:efflux RND transporter periplasmic adaptor subunit [Chitinophagales bacterium]
MKNNKLYYTLGLITILAIGIAVYVSKNRNANKSFEVETQLVTTRDIVQTVTASGKINPEVEVKISSDVSGEIIELTVKEGDVVKKGQLLARIKPESYQAILEQYSAQLDNTKAQMSTAKARILQANATLSQANAQYDASKNAFERAQELFAKKIISKADLESAESSYKTTKASVDAAKADIESAKHNTDAANYTIRAMEANIKEAKINLNKTTIYAPMDGIISLLNVKKGEKVVGTLQMTGTEMMRIANFENMEVRVDVSESEITKVKVNDTALVEVDAYLDRQFVGVVTEVANTSKGASSALTTADQSTNFVVKIRLLESSYSDLLKENPKPFLPGMSATVDIRTKRKNGVLAIPIQAVTTKDTIYNGSNHTNEIVFINNKGIAQIKEISVGIQDDAYIEVTAGLSNKEELISGPYNTISKDLKDGVKIKKVDKVTSKSKEKDSDEKD